MRIVMTGSSGLVGTALKDYLEQKGHTVIPLVHGRRRVDEDCFTWDPENGVLDVRVLEGCDAVIHLAGENIANGRWSDAKKDKIRMSRIQSTRLIAETIRQASHAPKVLLNASAIGYYGSQTKSRVNENSSVGEGFLAGVCRDWEAATVPAQTPSTRVVFVRTGVVLSPSGGMLKKVLGPFKIGLGGILGNGKQMMSWIALEDLVRIFDYCLMHEFLNGPVNAVSPYPVTNVEFTKALGSILHRPTIFPVPSFVLRFIFGDMADELLLSSSDVFPKKLVDSGFSFKLPNLEQALKEMLRAKG